MYFIAEIGINHNGDVELAKRIINMCKAAGADVVKFQKRNVDIAVPESQRNVMRETPWGTMTYYEYKKRMEFDKEEYDQIDHYCERLGIEWTASVWDVDSLNFILQYDVPFIKIPSACLTDEELLKAANKCGKPVVISIGMSTAAEMWKALSLLEDVRELTVLQCNSTYPTKDEELDLNVIKTLLDELPLAVEVGYSGHELGYIPTIMAATLGAQVIERHVTIDKTMWGTDQSCSLEFEELRDLIQHLKLVDTRLGKREIKCYPSEEKVKEKLRR